MLTDAQKATLAAALRAETNEAVVAAMAVRNDTYLAQWCNALSNIDAWNHSMQNADLFDATDITKFDGLTAGKRDAWRLMLDHAPVDAGRTKIRKAIQDVWGNTDSIPVLQACFVKATNAQIYLGGSNATTNKVTAFKRNFTGTVSTDEVSMALNAY